MELFGAKFCVALGAWRLRFVLMLEEPESGEPPDFRRRPHHVSISRDASRVG